MKSHMNRDDKETQEQEVAGELSEPSLYQIMLLNDDFTPKEFVIDILEKFLFMERRKATEVMQEAHERGKAGCGLFAKDYAEAKISQMVDYARIHEHPLTCSMETAG